MNQAILFFVLSFTALFAQAAHPRAGDQPYEPSPEYLLGRPNPDAPLLFTQDDWRTSMDFRHWCLRISVRRVLTGEASGSALMGPSYSQTGA